MKNYFAKKKKEKKKREVSVLREYFELISEVMIFVFFIMTFLVQTFVIPTGSMEDTLLIGDHLLVDKVSYAARSNPIDRFFLPKVEIRRGTIVTFKSPPEMEKEYVKRVIGLGGETIQIINKQVLIDGRPLNEPYTFFNDSEIQKTLRDNFPPYRIPEGHYFCMGDNRDNSYDSRHWGAVPDSFIVGRPWRIYWSFESTTEDYMTPGVLHKMKDLAKTVLTFFTKTRWERTVKKIK